MPILNRVGRETHFKYIYTSEFICLFNSFGPVKQYTDNGPILGQRLISPR